MIVAVAANFVCLPWPRMIMANNVGKMGPSKNPYGRSMASAPLHGGRAKANIDGTREPKQQRQIVIRGGMPTKQRPAARNRPNVKIPRASSTFNQTLRVGD